VTHLDFSYLPSWLKKAGGKSLLENMSRVQSFEREHMSTYKMEEGGVVAENVLAALRRDHIREGDKIPMDAKFMEAQDMEEVSQYKDIPKMISAKDCKTLKLKTLSSTLHVSVFEGKKVVLVSSVGAFTPMVHIRTSLDFI
jgi:hypothetical protein